MQARVTPSTTRRTTARALGSLLERRAARRQALRREQQLTHALAGDYGRGVRAEVLAAQARTAA